MGAVLAHSRESALSRRGLQPTKTELARHVTAGVTEITNYEATNPERQRFGSDAYLRHVAEVASLRGVPEITLWEEAMESWRFVRSVGQDIADAVSGDS